MADCDRVLEGLRAEPAVQAGVPYAAVHAEYAEPAVHAERAWAAGHLCA